MSIFGRALRPLLPLAFVATLTPTPSAAVGVVFSPPTDAAVLDPFRLPNGPYGAGNRGIEYDTDDGAPIVAAAAGTVAFAGPVAGNLFVSVDHPGGLRSTYGFVGHIVVDEGEPIERGGLVAIADGPFHFTARLDGNYIDPAPLFGRRRVSARLVPHHSSIDPVAGFGRHWLAAAR